MSAQYIMQTRRSKLTKRYKLTKKRSKNYKGGDPTQDDMDEMDEIMDTIKADLKPSPGLKYAWIIFGISSGYILLKLLKK